MTYRWRLVVALPATIVACGAYAPLDAGLDRPLLLG
jgi:hypothetical protein